MRVFCSAEADPFELFEKVIPRKEFLEMGAHAPADLVVDDNLGFTKDRTISRMLEMQARSSQDYFASPFIAAAIVANYDELQDCCAASRVHERLGFEHLMQSHPVDWRL